MELKITTQQWGLGGTGRIMNMPITETEMQDVESLLRCYFPDCQVKYDGISDFETENRNSILFRKNGILPYLQTILFEEHLVEIQLDQGTRLFFSHLLDNPPPRQEQKSQDNEIPEAEEYETGAYLKTSDHIAVSPMTPAIGNLSVRNSKRILLRFFTGTSAIDLGCSFRNADTRNDSPTLFFTFPTIGKISRNFRAYRVKVLDCIDAKVKISNVESDQAADSSYHIFDVSAGGLAFEIPGQQHSFSHAQIIDMTISVEGIKDINVQGQIRNMRLVRSSKGFKVICGVQFDLKTRALATELEKMAAAIQRLHLRELAERTANLHGVKIIR